MRQANKGYPQPTTHNSRKIEVNESDRKRQTIWVVLPAFNEASTLATLLQRIDNSMFEASLSYRIILVDDGSTDETPAIAESAAAVFPMQIETHSINKGLGSTIRDGLLIAAEQAEGDDVIVTLDADNTHTPELILRMVRLVREGHDVVIASRYQKGSRTRGLSTQRRILSYLASILLRTLFPIRGVRDYTSGYRAYRAGVLISLIDAEGHGFVEADGFQVMVDILLKLSRRKDLIFGEAPLILRYDFKDGASKMNVSATIKDTLLLVARRRVGL